MKKERILQHTCALAPDTAPASRGLYAGINGCSDKGGHCLFWVFRTILNNQFMRILKTVLILLGVAFWANAFAAPETNFSTESDNICLPGTIRILGSTQTTINLCSLGSEVGVISFRSSVAAMPTGFVVVDASNTIVYVGLNGNINFANYPSGTFRVYSFSFLGAMIGQVGQNLSTATLGSVCFRLSSNFISITNEAPEVGDLVSSAGPGPLFLCIGDERDDIVTFSTTGVGQQIAYVVTDTNNVILSVSTTGEINFEPTGYGLVRVWAVSYLGTFTGQPGDDLDEDELASDCFDVSDNFVLVNKLFPDAGQIAIADAGGAVALLACAYDAVGVVSFESQNAAPNAYVYMLTTPEGQIIRILPGSSLDFDALPPGEYRVWGVSYTGALTVGPGDFITQLNLSTDCDDRSDNFISLIRTEVDGGTIALDNGATTALLCTGDGQADALTFVPGGAIGDNIAYVITDADNTIIAISDAPVIDFDGSGEGVVRVWTLAYTGALTANPGENAATATLSSECYDLSENFVALTLVQTRAGAIALTSGATTALVCKGDAGQDVLNFSAPAAQSPSFTWVITDENNTILRFFSGNAFDFGQLNSGAYRVWALAYSGELLAQVGDDAGAVQLSGECSALSTNFVSITVEAVDGGSISLDSGLPQGFACYNDGEPDIFTVNHVTTVAEANYRLILTNTNNEIIAVLTGNAVDLDQAAPGNCRFWGVSYTGDFIGEVGDNAATTPLSTGCYELSTNFILIERNEVDGGVVGFEGGGGPRYLCPQPGNDVLSFDSTGLSTSGLYAYFITDANNTILSPVTGDTYNFQNNIGSEFRVWGVAYSGILFLPTGANATTARLSTQCYDLSDNFLTVIRNTPNGGMVATAEGANELAICPGDGQPDVISFAATGASNTGYAYIVTDENNIIQQILPGASFNFDGFEQGVSRVWGVAYTGTLTAQVGANIMASGLSNDCYDLSDNYVRIVLGLLSAGDVTVFGGGTVSYICPGDGQPNELSFFSENILGEGQYLYLVTDENNVIVAIMDGNSFDFEALPNEGVNRVWGLIYDGELLAQIGDNAAEVQLASSCYGLSNNFVTINRFSPLASQITTGEGATEADICSGDGTPDVFGFVVSNASPAALVYLVVEDGFLVGVVEDPDFDFEGTSDGDWQIYGLSYTGNLQVLPGDNIFEVALASDCYDLTENFVQLNKDRVDGGEIFELTTGSPADIYVCINDGQPNETAFGNSGLSGMANYVYVLTTNTNVILATSTTGVFNFETTAFPRLRVWGLSYTGTLSAPIGANVATAVLSDACYDLSNNFIAVFRGQANGGTISLQGGGAELDLCVANDAASVAVSTSSTSIVGYTYVVTDTNDVVIKLFAGSPVDFTDFAAGEYRIWGLSYTGNLLLSPGDTANVNTPASSCFQWSSNSLTVRRSVNLEGGVLSTQFGGDVIYVCPDDGNPDPLVISTTSTDVPYRYIFTDANGSVLVPGILGNIIDLSDVTEGEYRLYGVSYTGGYLVGFNTTIGEDPLSTDCWALSRNFIRIVAQTPDGGMVSTTDGDQTVVAVVGDGEPDVVNMTNTGADLAQYAYVVTDESNNILFFSANSDIDFEPTGVGICRVWGLSYTGSITAEPGDNAATAELTDDCFSLSSNFVTVIRTASNENSPLQQLEAPEAMEPSFDAPVAMDVTLWPNPASDYVRVNLSLPFEGEAVQLTLISVAGQQVFNQAYVLEGGQTTLEIPIAQYQPGIYFLRCTQGDTMKIIRLIKL